MTTPTHQDSILDVLRACGVTEEQLAGFLAVCGGRKWYIPSVRPLSIEDRNRAIYDAWNGQNLNELRRRFHLGRAQIYTIIRQELHRRKGVA